MELATRSWFYLPDKARAFVEESGGWAYSPHVTGFLWPAWKRSRERLWAGLGDVQAPVLVLYGCQDFEPISQAYEVRDRLPNGSVRLINQAGHLPWMEQPADFFALLEWFLGEG